MFGLFKRKPVQRRPIPSEMSAVLISDTRKTIRAVYDMPLATQREIANDIHREIAKADQRVALARLDGRQDQALGELVAEAAANRRGAAMQPGADWSDPAWAFYALTESWMIALSGAVDGKTQATLSGMISRMLDDVLPDGPYIVERAAAV